MRWPLPGQSDDEARTRGEGVDALTSLWDATRPAEPDDAAWDAVWAHVSDRLDRTELTVSGPVTERPWRRYAANAFMLAQAAALLATAVLWGAYRRPVETPAPLAGAVAPRAGVDIEAGAFVLIHMENNALRSIEAVPEGRPDLVDVLLVTYNEVESMAGTTQDAHAATPPG